MRAPLKTRTRVLFNNTLYIPSMEIQETEMSSTILSLVKCKLSIHLWEKKKKKEKIYTVRMLFDLVREGLSDAYIKIIQLAI